MEMIEVGPDEPMFLHPHEFVLGSTIERVRMPDDLVGRLEGRSSLGRLGVVIHSTAGFIDACFRGARHPRDQQSGELADCAVPGHADRAALVFVDDHAGRASRTGAARGSKYSGQQLPTASRLYLDFQR